MAPAIARGVRFVAVGLVATAVTYAAFRSGLALGLHYLLASALAWIVGMSISYTLNRRFTFSLNGRGDLAEVLRFVAGGVLQLAGASAGYALLMGRLHWDATVSFVLVTGFNCTLSFTYMRWLVFKSVAQAGSNPAQTR